VGATSQPRVLLVDDHPFVLEGLRFFLVESGDFDVVGEAANGEDALAQCEALLPAVVVMDVNLPKMNGIEATRRIRERCPDVKVLILTGHAKPDFESAVVDCGAHGYLSKNSRPAELTSAIKLVLHGEKSVGMARAEVRDIVADGLITLRERQVLALIAEGFSNREAASALRISVRTIEKHRGHLMAKLNLNSVVDLTRFAVRNGVVRADC
jgi:two-component system, NarL family, nitrate/nitrite response regulator NarL